MLFQPISINLSVSVNEILFRMYYAYVEKINVFRLTFRKLTLILERFIFDPLPLSFKK